MDPKKRKKTGNEAQTKKSTSPGETGLPSIAINNIVIAAKVQTKLTIANTNKTMGDDQSQPLVIAIQ